MGENETVVEAMKVSKADLRILDLEHALEYLEMAGHSAGGDAQQCVIGAIRFIRESEAAHAREVEALRLRAEAAEAACADAAVVIRHAQLHECGRWPGLLKALDKCAAKSAAIASGWEDRNASGAVGRDVIGRK